MVKVTTRLDRMALRYDYTIVCDNLRSAVVRHEVDEDGNKYSQWGVELTNPIEYTKEEVLNKYDHKSRVIKWVDTYTEAGEPAMAIVLDKRKVGE